MSEQVIAVGQVWRRKKDGKHIRIVRERRGWNDQFIDDWRWEGWDYKGRGEAYGFTIRDKYDLIGEGTP